jgi:hypothetical protein
MHSPWPLCALCVSAVNTYRCCYRRASRASSIRITRCAPLPPMSTAAIWLLGGLCPGYHSITNFRRDNAKALKALNREFVQLCRELDLIGGAPVGIDGSFFNASASADSVKTRTSLERDLARLDRAIDAYSAALENNDACDSDSAEVPSISAEQRETIKALQESGETQLSLTDPDARHLRKKRQGIGWRQRAEQRRRQAQAYPRHRADQRWQRCRPAGASDRALPRGAGTGRAADHSRDSGHRVAWHWHRIEPSGQSSQCTERALRRWCGVRCANTRSAPSSDRWVGITFWYAAL